MLVPHSITAMAGILYRVMVKCGGSEQGLQLKALPTGRA